MSRERCPQCTRPVAECYCDALIPINNHLPVIILQHPAESKHPYNTGRIINLCLKQCNLVQAELIPDQIRELIESSQALLLFPELSWLQPASKTTQSIDLLVVIDGTWKKAKKMLHLNPWLQSLPRLTLNDAGPSNYIVRKSSMADGLSTIESVTQALNTIDSGQCYHDLLRPFERMIALAERHHPKQDGEPKC